MNTVKLQRFEGDFHITKQEGVFVELLAMSWQSINGELFYLPNPHLGFKEWQEMGGSLSSTAKVKYTYGRLYCHKNQITNI